MLTHSLRRNFNMTLTFNHATIVVAGHLPAELALNSAASSDIFTPN